MSEAGRSPRVFLGDRPRARYVAVLAGYASAGVGLALALAHAWLPAAVCAIPALALLWRSGAVAAPRGADAYRGRVADALTMWAVETEAAFDHHAWRTATWLSALRRLRPPPGAETLHARVVALGERPSADEELAARAEDAAARFAEIEAIRRELAAARASDRDRAYAAAVDDALSECLRSSDTAIAEADAATPRTRRRLERARPPRGAAGAHADLLDAFVAHAVAYRAMLAACRHGDPAGARTAAERVNATAAARDRAWDAIVDALAADVRSPARRGADEAPR